MIMVLVHKAMYHQGHIWLNAKVGWRALGDT